MALARARGGGAGLKLRALALGFADSYLGFPKNRLNDDNGFVARLRIFGELADGEGSVLRIEASEQLITERGGLRRVDQGTLSAAYSRSFALSSWVFTLGGRGGIQLIGNLGGSQLQDWAHRELFIGRHLTDVGKGQLQFKYPAHLQVVPIVGLLAAVGRPLLGPLWFRTGLTAEGGAGTGLLGEVHPFVGAILSTRHLELEVRESGGIYGTTIRSLTIPGGYVTGRFEGQLSAHLTLLSPRPFPGFLALDLDWNRGNSHQHVGEITVGVWF